MKLIDKWRIMTNERAVRFEGEVRHRYELAGKLAVNKQVLDIGCGLGWGAEYLAKKKAKQVLGIDRSGAAINYAKTNLRLENLRFMQLDVKNIRKLKTKFDLVLIFDVLEHLPVNNVDCFIKDINLKLKPKGIVMISTPNKLVTRFSNPYHTQEFTPDGLVKLLGKYFTNLKLSGVSCVNRKLKAVRQKHELINWLGQSKLVQELLPLVPKQIKRKVTGEDKLPGVKKSEYVLSTKQVEKSDSLILIARMKSLKAGRKT
ncbi:MAG: class I SAM-dependent methyltransferase [Candidatus Beckwithbacteria bacterium]